MRYLIIFTAILTLAVGTEAYPVILTQLTTNPGTDWMPHWSPDGCMRVYVSAPNVLGHGSASSQDIYTIPATGGTPTKLTTYDGVDGYGPEYSPDGSRILYSTTMSSSALGIWSIPSGGGDPTYVYDSGANDYNASWNPDGSRIVFETHMGGTGEQLWIVDSDGSNSGLTQLTFGPDGDYHPDWSPDGDTTLFHSCSRSNNEDLWTVPAAGGTPVNLTNTSDRSEMFAAYSPDGQWIALEIESGGVSGLWVMPASGGETTLITDDVGHGCTPSWSPDGTMIAFARTGEDSERDIWIASDLPYPISPIPEPSTILLLTMGLGGILAYFGRSRSSKGRRR
jgi:Tol biopolymer transport system component